MDSIHELLDKQAPPEVLRRDLAPFLDYLVESEAKLKTVLAEAADEAVRRTKAKDLFALLHTQTLVHTAQAGLAVRDNLADLLLTIQEGTFSPILGLHIIDRVRSMEDVLGRESKKIDSLIGMLESTGREKLTGLARNMASALEHLAQGVDLSNQLLEKTLP